MSNILGNNLRKLRKSRKLTLKDVAKELHVDFSNYSKVERGEYEPKISTLIQISEMFDVSIDRLLGINAENKWRSVIDYCEQEELNPNAVLESLKHSVNLTKNHTTR